MDYMDEYERFTIKNQAFMDQTTVHPVGLLMLALLGILMLTLPRRRAMIAVLACASFIAVGQRIVIFTLDFNFVKLIILFGWARIFLRQEFRGFRLTAIDGYFIAWVAAGFVMYPISHGASTVVYKLGTSLESMGMFFLTRMLVRDLSDVRSLINSLAVIGITVACFFFVEFCTARNLFAVFGGVPEITAMREGKLRCQGAYTHPILAGCFWAAAIPLFVAQAFWKGADQTRAIAGLVASLAIVVMCASSTPMAGVMAAGLGFAMFPLRASMRSVRWLTVLVLFVLHMVMKKPVWTLIGRTDLIGGSTGWHRVKVIDQFINHFREWALFGVERIGHWNIHANDITNQYAIEGIRGGALQLTLFILLIATCFGTIGRSWRSVGRSPQDRFLFWSLGVSLFVHIINFLGVAYFGQIDVLWFIGLALAAVTQNRKTPAGVANAPLSVSRHSVAVHGAYA